MDWFRSILAGVGAAFDRTGAGPVAIPLAFALGLLSAVVSACCTLPVLSIVVGYAGTRLDHGVRARALSAGMFVLGSALALVILGAVRRPLGRWRRARLGATGNCSRGFSPSSWGWGR